MTIFYNRYCELCAKANKSVSGVAAAIGLSNAAANGWKKGKMPSDTNLAKLSDYFGVSVEWLKGESEQKEKHSTDNGRVLTPENYKIAYKDMTTAELYSMLSEITKELQERGTDET